MIIPNAALFADVDFTTLDVIHEYVGFVGTFFSVGAVAFYFLLLRPALSSSSPALVVASRTAARIGIVGALLRLLFNLMSASTAMTEKHLTLVDALLGKPGMIVEEVAAVIAIFAFAGAAFATHDALAAWTIAGTATLVGALHGLITTKLSGVVNPIHVFAASMWIGTLFVLAVAGIWTMLSGEMQETERSPAVAVIVNRFSTIALWSAGVLVLSGVTTAYLHIRSYTAVFTSIYGQTLLVKLVVVAGVFYLGAYNNRRLKPQLGTDEATVRLHRTATYEIALAAIVLIVTAVLVNLPAPAEQLAH
jgi:putative copper export protein